MRTLVIFCLYMLVGACQIQAQQAPVTHQFNTLDEALAYSEKASLDIIINNIKVSQAELGRDASKRNRFERTSSLSGTFTHFRELPVTLLPAEVLGGQPGESIELRAGVPYTTEFSQNAQIKVVNPVGWADYKLSTISVALSESNSQLTRKVIQENVADSYFSIVNLQDQLTSTEELLLVADSLYLITKNKYEEGLVSQQDVNNVEVNMLQTESNLANIKFLLEEAYLTFKSLCNIPAQDAVTINHDVSTPSSSRLRPAVEVNKLELKSYMLNQDWAFQNYKKSKSLLYPSLSFFAGNSFQLNNDSFQPFSGDWARSNYLGLTLTINLPNKSTRTNIKQARLDYDVATWELEKGQHASLIEKKKLENDYDKAFSEHGNTSRVNALNTDTHAKNFNLYTQGLIGVDRLLDSYEAMVNAEYAANAASISLELAHAKILINNTFN